MDERFDKVINKMDEQTEKAVEVQEKVSALFGDVKKTQKDIDGKVDDITQELEKTLTNFEKESKTVFDDIKSEFDKQQTGADEAVSDALGKLKSLQDDYEGKVKNLITSIDEKSKEILKIYDELENIKKVQQEAATSFGEIADTQKELISDFKEKSTELLSNSDIGNLMHIVETFQSRVTKLEKHAHKHTFGGNKI
ncbi:MAG: hypothetical protein H8E71_01075 [Candidatus Marinimicrobia bacterium]|nr:hypothetical protein [Candidatus Neomarinimicrobiota bacterium]